ncbi:MAG TPA: nucleotidyltransferase family protein [Geothrix sp.]
MNRQQVMQTLHDALPGIRERFGVQDLAIFGSVARDEAGVASDVDVLVTFDGRTRFRTFMGLQFELEAILGTKVDLVTPKALKPTLRPHIERDLIHVS